MKHAKMLGLPTVAAAALMAFAGTASATLTETAGDKTDANEPIHASTSGSFTFDGSVSLVCQKSTVGGEITTAGGTSGPITSLSFTECGTATMTVVKGGTFAIESLGSGKGTMRWSGTEITMLTHSFFLGTMHCIYVTNNTHIGTVTGGTTASLSLDSPPIPEAQTDGLCGEDMEWTGTYSVSTPDTLLID